LPGEPEDVGDRIPQVVVSDLAGRNTAERGERVDVSFQERLRPSGSKDLVDGLAGEGKPQREQHAGHQFAAQVNGDLAKIDLGFRAGPVGLGKNTLTGPRPASTRIFGLRSAT
jgi:hypothetical protein